MTRLSRQVLCSRLGKPAALPSAFHHGRSGTLRWLQVTLAFTFLLLASGRLCAAPAEVTQSDQEEARRHFERALELADNGIYAEAAAEFERAYQIAPRPTVLFNLAQMYVALDKPVLAIETFKRYLAQAGPLITAERRAQVEEALAKQAARVGLLAIETDVAGAAVRVDGAPVGTTPLSSPICVSIGVHTVSAVRDGFHDVEESITVTSAETKVRLILPPLPPPIGPASKATDDAVEHHREWTRVAGYAMGGVGLAAAATAVGVYFWNRDRYETWKVDDQYLIDNPSLPDFSTRRAAHDALGRSISRVSTFDVSLAIGAGALLTTGAIFWATSKPRRASHLETAPLLAIGPSSVFFQVDW